MIHKNINFFVFLFYLTIIAHFVCAEEKECTTNADCEIELSICVNSSCVCPPDFVPNNVYTKCLQVVHTYGESCTDSLQCSTSLKSGGSCLNNTCACQKGYHYLKGKCWKSLGLGDKCKKDENCFVSNDFESSVCDNKTKICICADGYYQREHSSCRRISNKPGDPCGIALDCKFDNAVCSMDRKCQVKGSREIYFYEEEIEKISFQSIYLSVGEKCKSSSDCPANAYCSSMGTCMCSQGFYSLDEKSCHPELGSNCTSDNDCLGKNTMCRDSKYCTCKQGFVASKDGKYCDKMSRYLGWSCLRDEQCEFFGPRSVCENKKCKCNNESRYVDDQMFCWISKKTGEDCLEDRDCGNGNVTCADSKCMCKPGNHPSSSQTTCRPDSVNFGDVCVESLDCVYPNSTCNTTENRCICDKGYIKDGTKCKPGNGGSCMNDRNCTVAQSHCLNSTCVCNEGYISSLTYDTCMALTTAYEGSCQDTVQCSKLNADCVNNKCVCRSGMHYDQGWQCYMKANIGQNCTMSGQCYTPNSLCIRGYCQCRTGYHPRFIGNQTICTNGSSMLSLSGIMVLISIIVSKFGI